MNLCNGEKLQAIAPVLSEVEEGQVAETIRYNDPEDALRK